MLAVVIISAISVDSAQDLFSYEFQLDTDTPGGMPKPAAPPAVKTYTDECLSDVKCSNSTYCSIEDAAYDFDCNSGFTPCAPRIPRLGAYEECRIPSDDRADGLHCGPEPWRI